MIDAAPMEMLFASPLIIGTCGIATFGIVTASLSGIVEPDSAGFRSLRRGDITIDNVDFLRYMGEVQIVKRELEPEERTNIAAKILPEEEFLIDTITPGRKFRFEFIR